VTREEFDAGWSTLRGAGLRGALEADPDVYYAAVSDMKPVLWSATVGRLVRLGSGDQDRSFYFPAAPELIFQAASAARDLQKAEDDRKREATRAYSEDGDAYLSQHPALKRQPGEGFTGYLSRLAVKLGYMTEEGEPVRDMPAVRKPYRDGDE
jgi:hypothetical protein